jgi:hypothetical protein
MNPIAFTKSFPFLEPFLNEFFRKGKDCGREGNPSSPFLTGEDLKEKGMAKVTASTSPDWKAQTEDAIFHLSLKGIPFTAEDVRSRISEPPHPNSLGAMFSKAVRAKTIHRISYIKAKRPSAHARIIAVYIGRNCNE